jgi:hypothetical protein
MSTRVWDLEEQQWVLDEHMFNKNDDLLFNVEDREWVTPADPSRFAVHRTMGLQALHGFEVWEGDIIRWGHLDDTLETKPREAIICFKPDIVMRTVNLGKNNHTFHFGSFAYADVFPSAVEVIGNIRENRGLFGALSILPRRYQTHLKLSI